MFGLIPLPYRILGAAILAALIFGAGFRTAWVWKSNAEQAAQVEAYQSAAKMVQGQQAITAEVSQGAAAHQEQVRVVTRTIVKEVPRYVSAKADAGCAVPIGALRVLGAAASGVPAVPDTTGQSDDAPSGVALSAVVTAGAEDLGTCQGVREQLRDLQGWLIRQQGLER